MINKIIELLIASIAVIVALIIFVSLRRHSKKQQREIDEIDKKFDEITKLASY